MKSSLKFCLFFFIILFIFPSQVSAKKFTAQDIIDLKKIGFTDSEIIAEIKKTGEKYKFTDSEIKTLKDNGISDAVIASLKETGTDIVKEQPAPQPLPVSTSPSGAKLTVKDITDLKKLGFTEADIINQLRNSGNIPSFSEDELTTLKNNGIGEDLISFLRNPKQWIEEHPEQAAKPETKPENIPEKTTETTCPPEVIPPAETPVPVTPQIEAQPMPQPAPQPASKIPQQLIGIWAAEVYNAYGNKIAYMQVQYLPDGRYTGYTTAQTAMGVQQTVNSGVVQVVGNMIQGYNQLNQPFSYFFQFNGNNQLIINMPEWGGNVTYNRQS